MADSMRNARMRSFFTELQKIAAGASGWGKDIPAAAENVAQSAGSGTLGRVVGGAARFTGRHWKPMAAAAGGALAYHHVRKIGERANQLREYNRALSQQQRAQR